jgi:hypothetical protein
VGEVRIDSAPARRWLGVLNVSLAGLVAVLLVRGLTTGVTHSLGLPEPEWVGAFSTWFPLLGFAVGLFMLRLILPWVPLFLRPAAHRAWREDHPAAVVTGEAGLEQRAISV